jgi:hypothetical protein
MDRDKIRASIVWLRIKLTDQQKERLRWNKDRDSVDMPWYNTDEVIRLGITIKNLLRHNGFSERELDIKSYEERTTNGIPCWAIIVDYAIKN